MKQPEVGAWIGQSQGFSFELTQKLLDLHLKSWEERGHGVWAVIDKASEKLIGHCGLKYRVKFDGVELLYSLDHQFWGRGLATEAATAAVKEGFTTLGLSKLISYTQPHNLASRRVMEKQGFVFIKNITHANLPHVFYELEKMNWKD